MLVLFEKFNSSLWQLQFSLFYEEVDFKTIVLEKNGFLAPNTTSPWSWLCKWENTEESLGLRLSSFSLQEGQELGESSIDGVPILNENDQTIAYIHYHDYNLKTISHITWFDKDGEKFLVEHYCSDGFVFARDHFSNGDLMETTFTTREQEIVGIQFNTGEFLTQSSRWHLLHRNHLYKNVVQFYQYYFSCISSRKDLLIYEDSDICRSFLKGISNPRCMLLETHVPAITKSLKQRHIVTPFKDIYESFAGNKNTVYCPYHYQSFDNSGNYNDVLITTMTDQIQDLEELLKKNPWANFRIAAPTEFSDGMKEMDSKYKNLYLYPSATPKQVDLLFAKSKVFLDISWGRTVFNSSVKAFSNNLLMLGLVGASTGKYIPRESLFDDMSGVFNVLNYIHKNPDKLDVLISSQQELIGKANHDDNGWSKLS